ncbi:MAG: DNA gyrase inhibitor YacG [Acidobacteria bacterium]|nr:DNA gyrase inhibitor YacG [Acidobacteriota bacterium]
MKCPGCGAEVDRERDPFRPFCSERCKMIDLGRWISEAYRVPVRSRDEEEDGDPTEP